MIIFELIGQPFDNHLVEIVTTEVGVAVGRFYFEYAVAKFENRNIERTTAKIEYSYLRIFLFLVEAVGQ